MRQKLSPLDPPRQLELEYSPIGTAPICNTALPRLRQWFRPDEVSKIFAVSNSQVHRWIDDGTLDARALHSPLDADAPHERRHKRVTRESVVRLLNDNTRRVV